MKLGTKTLLIITATFLVLITALLAVSQYVILGGFKRLEQKNAGKNVERVLSALNEQIRGLSDLNVDWASWDDSYRFMRERNSDYIKSNLNTETLAKQRLNFIIYADGRGGIVFGKGVDLHAINEAPLPGEIKAYIASGSVLVFNETGRKAGVISVADRNAIISAKPILTSKGTGPVRGTLIMGRYLDDQEVARLSDTTHLPVKIIRFDQRSWDDLIGKAAAFFDAGNILVDYTSAMEGTVAGYGTVRDIAGEPLFIVRIDVPRTISAQGRATLLYFIVYLIAAAFLSAVAILLQLKMSILSRLSRLGGRVNEIGLSGRLAGRVALEGNDEITTLGREINRMLASLEDLDMGRRAAEEGLRRTNDELESRVKERTAELVRINSDLNAEIAERKRSEAAMEEMIYHDYLTGLPNRLLFMDRLNQVIAGGRRQGDAIAAVLYLKLDNFQWVNDSFGHLAGDEFVKTVSGLLQRSVRESDTVARVGGDEFAILIPDLAKPDVVLTVIDNVSRTLKAPVGLNSHRIFVTASMGISLYPLDGTDSVTLLKSADIAMRHAMRKGGDTYAMYKPEMAERVYNRLMIGNKLRTALEREEFVMHYQPQYDLRSGRITGSEALIRWQDPERGLIPPLQFIPVAEESGIIVEIGEWGMRKACEFNRKLQGEGFTELSMSVNVTARMISQTDFAEKVKRILSAAELEPTSLTIEILENILLADLVRASGVIRDLKKHGVKFSIDDFGTGYSSLACLKNLSIDELKIDRSFINDVTVNQDGRLIVSAIINLAHSIGLDVTAEGVETQEQLDFLIDQQCDKMQGYFFSTPVPEDAFLSILRSHRNIIRSK